MLIKSSLSKAKLKKEMGHKLVVRYSKLNEQRELEQSIAIKGNLSVQGK